MNLTVPGVELGLTVNSQEEYKGLVEATRKMIEKRSAAFAAVGKQLSDRKREALYEDLGAAAVIAKVLLAEEHVDYLIALLDEHNIPVVPDPTKRNAFVPITRLLWGSWTKPTDKKPKSEFVWTRSTELYAKVLRGAEVRNIRPRDLTARLKEEKGFKQFKAADDAKYLKTDVGEKEKAQRHKDVINDTPIARVPSGVKGLSEKNGTLVTLLGRVNEEGGVDVLHRLPMSETAIHAAIDRLPVSVIDEIRQRRAERAKSEGTKTSTAYADQLRVA